MSQEKQSPPIFLISRFRSGSSLLYSMFDVLEEVIAFYEPLHPNLFGMLEANIPPQTRHFGMEGYFRNSGEIFQRARELFQLAFGIQRLLLESEDHWSELRDYLAELIRLAPGRAVLKFNRCDFRIPWLRRNFPSARILYLHRGVRDEWLSSVRGCSPDALASGREDPFEVNAWAQSLCDIFPFLAEPYCRDPYERFYYLWKLSLLAGTRQADASFAYEDLRDDPKGTWKKILSTANIPITSKALDPTKKVISPSRLELPWLVDFEKHEAHCEQTLDRLGLLEHFALQPLAEIIASNGDYCDMLEDREPLRWACRSTQIESRRYFNDTFEKQQVIEAMQAQLEYLQNRSLAGRVMDRIRGTHRPKTRREDAE